MRDQNLRSGKRVGRPKGSVRPTAAEAAARELRARGYGLPAIAGTLGTNKRWVEWACSSARRRQLGLATVEDIERAQYAVEILNGDARDIEKSIQVKRAELAELETRVRLPTRVPQLYN
ncbi:MAG: hypothetical protein QM778_33280 [Myxococcales bacterium]